MMLKILLATFSMISISFSASSKEFNCEAEFNWIKKSFSENDAGYQYAIDAKSEEAFKFHDAGITSQLTDNMSAKQCTNLIASWLQFFRSGHWWINYSGSKETEDANLKAKTPTVDIDFEEFSDYLNDANKHIYEGVWLSEPYKIGIKRKGNEFVGFIIESGNDNWKEKQIKFNIHQDGTATYFMGDHSPETFSKVDVVGNNYLSMGFVSLQRETIEKEDPLNITRYHKTINTNKPYFEVINPNTSYIRIPSFDGQYRKAIAELIVKHEKDIIQSNNLIIDIRNNGGGSDSSYKPLLPYLYTNPIRTVGVEYLSTPLNNQRMLDFIKNDSYGFNAEEKKWAKESYDVLSKQLGKFVSLDEEYIDITEFEEILPNPKQVAIIINEGNASTSEQFLLAAKQSKKVKLFGTKTAGILDISNMYLVDSPSGNYQLGYSLTKSKRIPEMAIDEHGIAPDFYINKSVKPYEWIDFVLNIIEN